MARETKEQRIERIRQQEEQTKAERTAKHAARLRSFRDLDNMQLVHVTEDRLMWSLAQLVRDCNRQRADVLRELKQVVARAQEAVARVAVGGRTFYSVPVSTDDANAAYALWTAQRTMLEKVLYEAGFYARSLSDEAFIFACTVEAWKRVQVIDLSSVTGHRYLVIRDDDEVADVASYVEAWTVASQKVEALTNDAFTAERERREQQEQA
jgi:hypothetical protein